jgi:hypothetical protein
LILSASGNFLVQSPPIGEMLTDEVVSTFNVLAVEAIGLVGETEISKREALIVYVSSASF